MSDIAALLVPDGSHRPVDDPSASAIEPDSPASSGVRLLPRRRRKGDRTDAEYMPTPEEIRQRCGQIQSEWSAAERRRRVVYRSGMRATIHCSRLLLDAEERASGDED